MSSQADVSAGAARRPDSAAMPSGAEPAGRPPPPPRSGPPGLPQRWPPAWPSLWPLIARRAAFVAVVDLLTLVGLSVAADPATQWWALLPPLVLLAGPLTHPVRIQRRARRAAATGRLDLRSDGLVLIRSRLHPRGRSLAHVTPDGQIRYCP
jgi:hypothetical protein